MFKKLVLISILLVLLAPLLGRNPVIASSGCEYIGEFFLEQGWVQGPAIIQPANQGYVLMVFPGTRYFNQVSDGTIWVYQGDSECLLAQYEFFQGFEIVEIKNLYTGIIQDVACKFLEEVNLVKGWVDGPAVIQPANQGYVLMVFPGTRYYNQIYEGTMWIYQGDSECLRAQYEFFKEFEIIEIEEIRFLTYIPLILH